MKLFSIERPSALPAALVGVVPVPAAHSAELGRSAAWAAAAGSPQVQVRARIAVSLTLGGNADMGIDRGQYATKRASGVPPRGRPV